jgi:hypothetical protein
LHSRFYLPFNGPVSLYVISAIFGLAQGGVVPSYAVIIRELFPGRRPAFASASPSRSLSLAWRQRLLAWRAIIPAETTRPKGIRSCSIAGG